MSPGDINPFDKETFGLDLNIFGPLLRADLTSTPTPFQISCPLDGSDFRDPKAGDSFVLNLNDTTSHVTSGFQHHATFLTHKQWLRTTSQLLAAILQGLGVFHPDGYFATLHSDLNLAKGVALGDIGKAIGSLNKYFKSPPLADDFEWQQCVRCLQVCGTTVTKDHLKAQLITCNGVIDAAKSSILNQMCSNYRKDLLTQKDAAHAAAADHAVMQIISENPPPFSADLHILEWAKREATAKKASLMVQIEEKARTKAKANYETFLVAAELQYTNDVKAVQEDYNKRLAEARKEWEAQLVSLKADLKAQYHDKKATLKHNRLIGRTSTRKSRHPDPLQATTRQRSRSHSCARSELSYEEPTLHTSLFPTEPPFNATQIINVPDDRMITNETGHGNSPMPKADTPLAPTVAQDPVMQLLLSIQKQLQKTDQRLEQTDQCLATIERGKRPHDPSWDDTTDYNAYRIDDLEYGQIPTAPGKEPTPVYEDKLVHDRTIRWGGSAFNQSECLKDEMDERNDDEPKKALDDILNEIHDDGEEFVEQGRCSLAALRGTAEYPITLFDSQASSTPRPPPKQENRLPVLTRQGTLSYATKAGMNKPVMPPARNAAQTTNKPHNQPLLNKQLEDPKVTHALIVAHAHATFGVTIPFQKSTPKATIVEAYKMAAAAARAASPTPPRTVAPQPSAPSRPNPNSNPNRPNTTLTSTWTIRRNSGCAGLPFTKPYGGDATTLVRYLQDAIRATSQGRSPPIDLLGGRWSWNQPNNFVLIFAEQPSIEQVWKYHKVILKPFDDSFQLIPSRGFI
jgi:hypothetical protein